MIPVDARANLKDMVTGRSLKVPNGEGGTENIRTTTLKPHLLGPRKRTIVEPSDYGKSDLAFAEVGIRLDEINRRGKVTRIQEIPVDPFATVSTGFIIEQIGLHGNNPEGTIIFSNTAPRGGNGTGSIVWEGEEGNNEQRFIFGVLDTGVPVLAVNTGYNLSFVKDRLAGLWIANVPNNGTQFRSRDNYPQALQILQGRRGKHLIGDALDPKLIPDPPKVKTNAEGELEIPVMYKDGYDNLKTGAKRADLSEEVLEQQELWARTNDGEKIRVVNKLAGGNPQEGDVFLTEGSSGGNPYLEINQMFGRAGEVFGIERITDQTVVVFESGKR